MQGFMRGRHSRGTTFLETMLAVIIVGVSIVALVEFMGRTTAAHGEVQRLMRASDLAGAGLEYAATQPLDTLRTYETSPRPFSPPINAQGVALPSSEGWSQEISARSVDENALQQPVTPGTSNALWVTVTVKQNGRTIYTRGRLHTGAL